MSLHQTSAFAPEVSTESVDLAIIGAGPAGLAAAAAAARAGASVIALDLHARAGGQYSMVPGASSGPLHDSHPARMGRAALAAAEGAGARILTGAEVFWAEARAGGFDLHVALDGGRKGLALRARAVIAATGAMERPLPFPGWTLPGVIGAGAAQRLLKAHGTLPQAGKVVLAGSGPFLLAVAQTFAKAGARLDHLIEARPARGLSGARLIARHPARWGEALALFRDVAASGAERRYGHVVTRAFGRERLEAVEIAPLGADGRPDLSRARRIDGVGTLCIGYGFQPVIDVTTALGAEHDFDPSLGGWHCRAAMETGATSVPGLFAAGETIGFAGAVPARLSGTLAGRAAAAHALGRAPVGEAGPVLAALRRARAFAADLARHWPALTQPPVALPDEEMICRCEDVTAGAIRGAIASGASEIFAVKMWTRASMGPCQGRVCGAGIAALLAEAGITPARAGYNRSHLPLRPVPLATMRATLAAFDSTETKHD